MQKKCLNTQLKKQLKNFVKLPSNIKHEKQSLVKYKHADVWLDEAIKFSAQRFINIGYEVPRIRSIYGFTTNGYTDTKSRVYLRECLARSWSNDNIIIIVPHRKEAVDVLGILGHEIAHVIDDYKSIHGRNFIKTLKEFGYQFQGAKDYASWEPISEYRKISQELGLFPSINLA